MRLARVGSVKRAGLALTLAMFGLLLSPSPGRASLINETVDCAISPTGGWACQPTSAVVGAGTEFDLILIGPGNVLDVDLDAWTIDVVKVGAGSLSMGIGELLQLSGLDSIFITGFALQTTGAISGFDSSDITFTPHSFDIVLHASSWESGSSARITIEGRDLTVPEPATLTLLGVGLVGLARRRYSARFNG